MLQMKDMYTVFVHKCVSDKAVITLEELSAGHTTNMFHQEVKNPASPSQDHY